VPHGRYPERGRENVMFGPEAVRAGERASCVCLVGLKRGWPRIMRSSEWAGEAEGIRDRTVGVLKGLETEHSGENPPCGMKRGGGGNAGRT
jgi:hypothetical protein